MHADCRAQSRCDKCSAPFASSAALAKHKRFCDAASSTLKAHIESDSRSNFSERSSAMISLRSAVVGASVLPSKEYGVVRSGEISVLPIKNSEGELKLNTLTPTSTPKNNRKCEIITKTVSSRHSSSGNTSTNSSENNSARSSPGVIRSLEKMEENVRDVAPGKLTTGFPASLMFPQTSPTLYSPFTSMAMYPQLFAPRNHINRIAEKGLDHLGKRSIVSSLSPVADRVADRENKTTVSSSPNKEQNNNETDGEEILHDIEQREGNKEPKKTDTPLDLSVQKHSECQTSECKAEVLRWESFKNEGGSKNRKNPKSQHFHERNLAKKHGQDTPDFISTKGAMTRCKDLQISSLALPPHMPPNTFPHQLLDEFVISMESNGVTKPGNLSSIVAPRPLHPYSRLLANSHHLTALHASYHPTHFSSFIHNSLPTRNDLSNTLAATSPTWQSKVGNR